MSRYHSRLPFRFIHDSIRSRCTDGHQSGRSIVPGFNSNFNCNIRIILNREMVREGVSWCYYSIQIGGRASTDSEWSHIFRDRMHANHDFFHLFSFSRITCKKRILRNMPAYFLSNYIKFCVEWLSGTLKSAQPFHRNRSSKMSYYFLCRKTDYVHVPKPVRQKRSSQSKNFTRLKL